MRYRQLLSMFRRLPRSADIIVWSVSDITQEVSKESTSATALIVPTAHEFNWATQSKDRCWEICYIQFMSSIFTFQTRTLPPPFPFWHLVKITVFIPVVSEIWLFVNLLSQISDRRLVIFFAKWKASEIRGNWRVRNSIGMTPYTLTNTVEGVSDLEFVAIPRFYLIPRSLSVHFTLYSLHMKILI